MALESLDVSKYRAIMTTTDRERISGEVDVPDSKRYQTVSRVRSRIEELETDVRVLEEHHPELLEELREVVCAEAARDLSFSPINKKNVSYGPSSREDAAYVLRIGTEDGTVEIHLDEDAMYELWTEVQHTPWPDRLDEQEEVGRLRRQLVEFAMGADADSLRAALDAMDDRPPGEREWE